MNKDDIEKALERIELQLKANWWDNLMYFCIELLCIAVIVHILIGIIHYTAMFIGVSIIILVIIIQICEWFQKRTIRRMYRK